MNTDTAVDMEELQKKNSEISVRDDPIIQLNLIEKYVKVNMIKNYSFEGFLRCFDPVSYSLILLVIKDGGFKSTLIPGHAILDIIEIQQPAEMSPPRRTLHTTAVEDITRKNKLMEWLKSNLLPVTDIEDRIVFGNVSVLPPYTVSDICTDSPMICMQVKKLIENMPDNTKIE